MGNKAYGMSQPILSVTTEQSMTDNEDHSDASGSPTQPSTRPNSSLPPAQSAPPLVGLHHTSNDPNGAHSPHLSGLPPVDLGPPKIIIDGLPASPESIHVVGVGVGSSNKLVAKLQGNAVDRIVSGGSVGSGLSDSTSTEVSDHAIELIMESNG